MGWYFSTSSTNTKDEDVVETLPGIGWDNLWGKRLKEVENELVSMYEKKPGSESDLAKKISPDRWNIFFVLRDDKKGLYPEPTEQKRALSLFCQSDRKSQIDPNLAKKFCED